MWLKSFIILLLFFVFAITQASFFLHFNILGAGPDFIFILFFLLVFFEDADSYYGPVLWSVVAGLFLDILSYSYFGISIFLLLAIVFLCKKALRALSKREDRHPLIYFLPLFAIFYAFHEVLSGILFYLLDPSHIMFNLSWVLIIQIIYNLVFAAAGFYIYRLFARNIRIGKQGMF